MMQHIHPVHAVRKTEIGNLVVYNWEKLSATTSPKVWENVELIDNEGQRVWTVNGMEKWQGWNCHTDTFVGTRVKGGRIQLTTFSGNSFDVDLATGEVNFDEFHK